MKIIFLLIPILSGCASYHVGHYKRALPGGYDRISIPMFHNKTDEVGIETFFTKALRTEFERSNLARVTSSNDAQVILEGTVSMVTYTGSNPTSLGEDSPGIRTPNPVDPLTPNPLPKGVTLNRTYTSQVLVKITARKVADNSILWQGDFTSQRNYAAPLIGSPTLTSANALYNQNSRIDTMERQAKDLMSEAHDRLTENF